VSEVTELWNLDQNLFQKIKFFLSSKLNGRKSGFNTPLSNPKTLKERKKKKKTVIVNEKKC